jgi:hypothetical protein
MIRVIPLCGGQCRDKDKLVGRFSRELAMDTCRLGSALVKTSSSGCTCASCVMCLSSCVFSFFMSTGCLGSTADVEPCVALQVCACCHISAS